VVSPYIIKSTFEIRMRAMILCKDGKGAADICFAYYIDIRTLRR
jgi:hypothetical protein